MKIGGFQKQSFIDYHGHISAVIFTQGCNFKCDYCHNPKLILKENYGTLYDETDILNYLKEYHHLLDAVCITGGEPCLHKELPEFIKTIKSIGLKVKLDTNGINPKMLDVLIKEELLDFIAMDIKHELIYEPYQRIAGSFLTEKMFLNIWDSIGIIKRSKLGHEFRTTVVKGVHSKRVIRLLQKQFGQHFKLQNVNPTQVLHPEANIESFTQEEFEELQLF